MCKINADNFPLHSLSTFKKTACVKKQTRIPTYLAKKLKKNQICRNIFGYCYLMLCLSKYVNKVSTKYNIIKIFL